LKNIDAIKRAVLWDMDGVLVDSAEYHFLAWQAALRELERHEITYDQFQHTFGQRNDTVLRDIFGASYADDNIARVADHKEAMYRMLVRERGIAPLPGVMTWLAHLYENGWAQAVASAAPRANVEAIVEALGIRSYFGALTSAEDVTRGKPDPQVYLLAAERVGALPSRSIVIEDAPAGAEGARRAGMACIGVLSSHGQLQADVVVQSLDDLHAGVFDELIAK
jgi:HAD superfamily hydrolase (TIGR01509 family)